jgi:nicotinamide-nucleotide amidase
MNAEIISIGTELLLGEINDTNATWIAQQLKNIGLNLYYRSTVGDNEERITDVIKLAMSRADIIITTGGLGPTVDDMTRQGVANAVNQPLERREELVAGLREKFKRFNAPMSESNLLQAMMPRDAIAVENPVGTAPSFIVETERGAIISLPGVPREMKYLMENAILPYLQKRVGASVIKLRILRTAGAGESWLGEQLNDLMRMNNPTVGTAAHSGFCDVRITAKAPTEAEADTMISETEAEVRKRVGGFIFGVDKDSLEGALVAALEDAETQLAIFEVGTDGMLRQRLESTPGSPEVIYEAAELETMDDIYTTLSVSSDTDLNQLAEMLIEPLLEEGAGIVICIISDPNGTLISVSDGTTTRNRSYAYGGVDAGGPDWATGWGMSMAWKMLRDAQAENRR